jgi:hypothetical protein
MYHNDGTYCLILNVKNNLDVFAYMTINILKSYESN